MVLVASQVMVDHWPRGRDLFLRSGSINGYHDTVRLFQDVDYFVFITTEADICISTSGPSGNFILNDDNGGMLYCLVGLQLITMHCELSVM